LYLTGLMFTGGDQAKRREGGGERASLVGVRESLPKPEGKIVQLQWIPGTGKGQRRKSQALTRGEKNNGKGWEDIF